jgi:hypothetical protein
MTNNSNNKIFSLPDKKKPTNDEEFHPMVILTALIVFSGILFVGVIAILKWM